ncbi:hypothetical protein [uncultured Boseongicola sp.]|uniref:hypothetical protein n=1 Tax=uncultured Boseongicola sp. TaxID=1648499 RepID=UPI002632292C|nr:hypothetical protein [uncultured Boseongicola sp.]
MNIQGAKATVSPLGDLANRLTVRIRARRERRRLTALLELGDHILCDIGLTEGDVTRKLSRPLCERPG